MTDDYKNGWREYSRFVLAMLERLDEEVKKLNVVQEQCQHEMPLLRNELFKHVDTKFEQLAAMHQTQLTNAKKELEELVKKKDQDETEVNVAAVTGSWEFRTSIATGLVSIILALIAIFT